MANIMSSTADILYGTANMAYKEAKIWLPKSHLKFLKMFMPADPSLSIKLTTQYIITATLSIVLVTTWIVSAFMILVSATPHIMSVGMCKHKSNYTQNGWKRQIFFTRLSKKSHLSHFEWFLGKSNICYNNIAISALPWFQGTYPDFRVRYPEIRVNTLKSGY